MNDVGTRRGEVDASVSREPLALDADDLATVCVLCTHNCGLRVDVEGGRIARVRADKSHPITGGYICNKAATITNYVEHGQRTSRPLKRRDDGGFDPISWEQAIGEISARMAELKEEHGPRSIGLVGVGGQANHMDAPYASAWLRALGSRRFFNAYAQEKTQHNLLDQLMFDAPPSVMFHADVEHTRFLMVMGSNPRISNRGHNANETFRRLAKDSNCEVVVVDPRRTETTKQADRHLQLRPASDAWFLAAVAGSIVQNELHDVDFLASRTTGFEELRDLLCRIDVSEMEQRCGLEAGAVSTLAADFAASESSSIMFDLGVEQTPFSTLVSWLIRLNLALTGNLGRGGNLFVEGFGPPSRSANRFDEPERTLAAGIQAIRALGNFMMFSPTLVPEEVLLDHPERLRAVVVEGSNPLLSFTDAGRWREAIDRLDLLVVIDPAFTETARLADYVLPTPCGYEKWELAMFPKRYPEIDVQLRPPLVPGPAEALPEAEIYMRLCEAMGLVEPAPESLLAYNEDHSAAARQAFLMEAMTLATEAAARGIDVETQVTAWAYRCIGGHFAAPSLVAVWLLCQMNATERLDSVLRTLGEDWRERTPGEIGEELFARIMAHPESVEVARQDPATNLEDNIGYDDGLIRLAPAPMVEELQRALNDGDDEDKDYPIVLAGGLRTRWTANTIQRDPAWRRGKGPHCPVNISAEDAQSLGLRQGDRVRVETRRASLELPAVVDENLRSGHAWIPNGFGTLYSDSIEGPVEVVGVNCNELMDISERDPITGIPHTKALRCRISAA